MKIKIKLLDRYIWKQLFYLFIGSVILLTSLAVALGTVSDLTYKISEYNLPLITAIQIFFLKIPEYAAYAFPISLLLTTLLTYGRFKNNSELIAFSSAGIRVYSLVFPAIVLSFLIAIITFLLNEFVVPPANYQVAKLESKFIPETIINIQSKDVFYPEYQDHKNEYSKIKRLYYAKSFDGNNFKNIMIIDWQVSQPKKIIIADRATWNQQQKNWQLFKGRIETVEDISSLPVKVEFFERKKFEFASTFFEIANQTQDSQKMSLSQARQYLKLIINNHDEPKIRLVKVRIQQKLAFPFICLVFALIGSSIGINVDRINRSTGFGLCVGIVFSYYLLGFMIGSLGIVGLVSPPVAAWLPNFLGGGIGAWLLWYSDRLN